jgi:hypothetical protein
MRFPFVFGATMSDFDRALAALWPKEPVDENFIRFTDDEIRRLPRTAYASGDALSIVKRAILAERQACLAIVEELAARRHHGTIASNAKVAAANEIINKIKERYDTDAEDGGKQ